MKKSLMLATISLWAYSCSPHKKIESVPEKNNLVPLVEYYIISEGELISGKSIPGRRIDSPGYSFNPETHKLEVYKKNKTSDFTNPKIFLGVGHVLKGVSGQGVSSFITAIQNLPYQHEDLIIESYQDSTISILLKGKPHKLKPNERYIYTKSRIDSLPNNTLIRTNIKWSLEYRGFVKIK